MLVFTKPAVPGRVKTRLIGAVTADQAAALHAAFYDDLLAQLEDADSFALRTAWALDPGESPPAGAPMPMVQQGSDLGARLFHALEHATTEHDYVAAIGVDMPDLPVETIAAAFDRLAAGTDVVIGPAEDGGYYLIALHRDALHRELFEGIAWSTESVLSDTRMRCARLGLRLDQLEWRRDVDVVADLHALAERLRAHPERAPRTLSLLEKLTPLP